MKLVRNLWNYWHIKRFVERSTKRMDADFERWSKEGTPEQKKVADFARSLK